MQTPKFLQELLSSPEYGDKTSETYSGDISKQQLNTYELDIPEFDIEPRIWRWHSEHGENTCDECSGLDGQVFFSPDEIPDIPVHPNCKCSITEETLDKNAKQSLRKITRQRIEQIKTR